ncbi:hypothetical protein [Actinomadura alba]|uniref:Uncharacterized protein n=1 Tax=Actinomadura alba TaxID=406431 RepID=A0ABR7LIR5_9ACTN|nr:hypothetical protein [Actinomadura alba]MBC6464717.1 hypothetical protein [Actinomadura alba]
MTVADVRPVLHAEQRDVEEVEIPVGVYGIAVTYLNPDHFSGYTTGRTGRPVDGL